MIAAIAAVPPTLAAILGYLASRRSLRRSIGSNPGMPLRDLLTRMEARFETRLDRFEGKVDRIVEQNAAIRERLSRLEVGRARPGRTH